MSYDRDTVSPPPRRSDPSKGIGMALGLLAAAITIGGIVFSAGRYPTRDEFEGVKNNVQSIQIEQVEQSGTLRVMETKLDVASKIDALERTLRGETPRSVGPDPLGRRRPR